VVCCICSGLCYEFITSSELVLPAACVCVCVITCDIETSIVRRPGPELGCSTTKNELRNSIGMMGVVRIGRGPFKNKCFGIMMYGLGGGEGAEPR
jgi:hypothetical protein